MSRWLLAATAALAVEGAALACSCMSTDDPVQLRGFAADAARGAVAVVEAEALSVYQPRGPGERLAVRRVLAGQAPGEVQLVRGEMASSASCDDLFIAGQRKTVILYPASDGNYRVSSLCTALLLDKPIFLNDVVRRIGGPPRGPERG